MRRSCALALCVLLLPTLARAQLSGQSSAPALRATPPAPPATPSQAPAPKASAASQVAPPAQHVPGASQATPAGSPPLDPQALVPPPLIKPDDSQAPARVDPAQLDRAYHRARTTRNVGLSLAIPGIALTLAGGVVLIFTSRAQQIFTQSSQIIGGTISTAAGLAIAVPGIYFWTTGQDDMDSVVWRRQQLTSSPP
jgi:hypothetical protein